MEIIHDIGFLFDLDGVIIDSERKYTEIWREIDSIYPTGVSGMEYKIKGTTLDHILNTYFPDPVIQKCVTGLLYDKEQTMIYDYTKGARELLEKIKASGLPAALVTSSNGRKMERLWRQRPELKGYFNVIIDGSQVSHSKPDPEGYLKASEAIGVNPSNCAVFEDSLQGVTAGKLAGAFVIGVAGTMPDDIMLSGSDFFAGTLDDVDFPHLCSILRSRN